MARPLLTKGAAQRAFRQRKEGYIKKLEEQVRDYSVLNDNFKAVQTENYQLRDYIISLQSRLLESQGEFPPPPSNVDGLHPGKVGQPLPLQQSQSLSSGTPRDLAAVNQLLASAEQVANDAGMPDRIDDNALPPSAPYNVEEPPRAKRARVDAHEMSAAQEALQGTSDDGPGGAARDVVTSR